MGKPLVTVIIPCLNEAVTIKQCIEDVKKSFSVSHIQGEILVADNGSTDGSQELALQAGARVVPVSVRGYGSALHQGILSAQSDIILFGDADLSYPFQHIKELIEPIKENRADFVLGSRLKGTIQKNAMPLLNRYFGTPLLSFLIRFFYKLKISDCNSGMRALRRSSYLTLNLSCPGMEYASEMLVRSAQLKLRYHEVPIEFHKDQRNRAPHLSRWRDGWRHLRYILSNAPSMMIIFTPALIGILGLTVAFGLSFQTYWNPGSYLRYHLAFILIGLAIPLFLSTNTFILVRLSGYRETKPNKLLEKFKVYSENAAMFYCAMFFFVLTGIQISVIIYQWWKLDFGELNKLAEIIRAMIWCVMGGGLFSLDVGLGLFPFFSPIEKNINKSE
ncbi:MAG: glycosyltransferase family 2 protein [Elusimicrobiota bacterium]